MADQTINAAGTDWLAGFTDGEGCFTIAPNTGGGFVPRFKISLRADDKPILDALHEEFGGFVSLIRANGKDHTAVQWVVSSKRDLARLRAYFDEHPLRAKKRHDYAIWRDAVVIYCARGGKAPELSNLRDALIDVRREIKIPDLTEAERWEHAPLLTFNGRG